MNELDGFEKQPVMMLKCVGSETASDAAVAIVEGMLTTVIRDFSEIVEDNVVNSWMDDSYASKAHMVLDEQDYPGSYEDEVERSAIQAEQLMSSIMANNHSVLQGFSDGWMVDEVTVLRRLPNLWVVQVIGSRFPF